MSTPSVSNLRFSGSPLNAFLAPPAALAAGAAGEEAGAGAGEPILDFSFEFFSCSTSFFHLMTSSEAARAISLLGFDLSFPT